MKKLISTIVFMVTTNAFATVQKDLAQCSGEYLVSMKISAQTEFEEIINPMVESGVFDRFDKRERLRFNSVVYALSTPDLEAQIIAEEALTLASEIESVIVECNSPLEF